MQYSIKRGLENNYFIIETDQIDDRDLKTIKENNLNGFMDSKTENVNNKTKICYEISGCINMSSKFPYQTLKSSDVKTMINSIIDVLETIDEYLLSQKSLILLPDLIFYRDKKPNFCYLPGYVQDINSSFCKLVDFMMSHIDYTDEKSVKLIYELNAKIKTEEFNIYNLRDYIDNFESKPHISMPTRDVKLAAEQFYGDGRFGKEDNNNDSEQDNKMNPENIRKIAVSSTVFGSLFIALLIYLINTGVSGFKIVLSGLICLFLCVYVIDKQTHVLDGLRNIINEYRSSGDSFDDINWSEIN